MDQSDYRLPGTACTLQPASSAETPAGHPEGHHLRDNPQPVPGEEKKVKKKKELLATVWKKLSKKKRQKGSKKTPPAEQDPEAASGNPAASKAGEPAGQGDRTPGQAARERT